MCKLGLAVPLSPEMIAVTLGDNIGDLLLQTLGDVLEDGSLGRDTLDVIFLLVLPLTQEASWRAIGLASDAANSLAVSRELMSKKMSPFGFAASSESIGTGPWNAGPETLSKGLADPSGLPLGCAVFLGDSGGDIAWNDVLGPMSSGIHRTSQFLAEA